MSEFIPSATETALERKLKRIDRECERRIEALFPIQAQLFLMVSMLADLTGYGKQLQKSGESSAGYLMARDRERVIAYMQAVTDHRHAAEALKAYVANHPTEIHSIDVNASKWWVKIRTKTDANETE